MRDPFSWSFPIGRLFGITVRVHILLIVVFLGLYLRVALGKDATGKPYPAGFGLDMLIFLGLAFVSVLLHEFGHCYGAYLAEGEAQEVLLWPLGGLAFVDVPHTPRANFIATAMGPAVNLVLCLFAGMVLASGSLLPPFNPFWDFFEGKLSNWAQGADFFNGKYYAGANVLEPWQLLVARLFYVNWVLFLLNVLVLAYPMDGGRLLQAALWPRKGYRRATLAAVFSGFLYMIVIGIVALVYNEVFWLALALFIFASCRQQWLLLETGGEDALFGYDFSQGYTSLEKDQPPPPRKKRPNFFQRWLQRRAQKKLQAEVERREADDSRMDQLLEKIQREGRQSLTDEENRFLKRVADKYRNRP